VYGRGRIDPSDRPILRRLPLPGRTSEGGQAPHGG
jgi:hypothetical protein